MEAAAKAVKLGPEVDIVVGDLADPRSMAFSMKRRR
jgi:hypothetical protein